MQNFEPSFKPDGYEVVYDFGADLAKVSKDKPDDLYQDMLKPFEWKKPDPVITLPTAEYEEKLKQFFEEITIKDTNEQPTPENTSVHSD